MLTYETAIILINLLGARIQEMELLIEGTEAELAHAEEKVITFEQKIRELQEKMKKQGENKK